MSKVGCVGARCGGCRWVVWTLSAPPVGVVGGKGEDARCGGCRVEKVG
ncbi:hypothetical protein K1T71_014717 [Dendrolimus kikuchii]|nr:hypothetical protein K1T71_014717 [Dendrolimus kikuchii]